MYITVHSAAGAALGQFIPSAPLAFAIGFCSHIILDMIPHGDEWIKTWKIFKTQMQRTVAASFIDFIGVIIMSVYWINYSSISDLPYLLSGIAGAIAPDALWGLYELTKTPILSWYRKFHTFAHHAIFKKELSFSKGLLIQLPILIICTWIISKF